MKKLRLTKVIASSLFVAHDTTMNGYTIGADGTRNGKVNTTGIYYWDDDIKHMNNGGESYSYWGPGANKTIQDNLGNTYSDFLTLRACGASSTDNYAFVEFPLNGQFKQFKSKLGLTKDYQSYLKDGTVKIYLDDVEVYSTGIKSGDLLKDINVDLTGKNKIKFYFKENEKHGYNADWMQEIGFFDGQFIK